MTLISPAVAEVFEKVKSKSPFPEKDHVWYNFLHGDGPRAGGFIAEMASMKGFNYCGACRAQFLDELVKLIPKDVGIKLGKRVVDIVENKDEHRTMKIWFGDGTFAQADAVVGCDGIRSACRQILLGHEDASAKAVYSGKYAYRKVVSMKKAVEVAGPEMQTRQIYVGKGGHLLMFPINDGKSLNIVAFKDAASAPWTHRQWVVPSSREDLLKDFKGWDEKSTKVLELIETPDKWALFEHLPAPTYAKGRFCLLGDAAHAATPHGGAGAGFAIEDVHLLSGLLTPELIKSVSDIRFAFQAYDAIRRPRSQELVRRARIQGGFLDLHSPGGEEVTDEMLTESLGSNMKWIWDVNLDRMLVEARQRFQEYKDGWRFVRNDL